jgi:hypothetical protein
LSGISYSDHNQPNETGMPYSFRDYRKSQVFVFIGPRNYFEKARKISQKNAYNTLNLNSYILLGYPYGVKKLLNIVMKRGVLNGPNMNVKDIIVHHAASLYLEAPKDVELVKNL